MFFDRIKVEENDCFDIEQKTILQSNSFVWFNLQRNRLTSSNAHKILIRKRNFETLANKLLKPEMEKNFQKVVKDALKHGKLHEPTARRNYTQYLKFFLKHDINVRETGLVIERNLFWLATSPDDLVSENGKVGLVEIKCPKLKCNHTRTPQEILQDAKFCVHYDDGKLRLKNDHSHGYYTSESEEASVKLSG